MFCTGPHELVETVRVGLFCTGTHELVGIVRVGIQRMRDVGA